MGRVNDKLRVPTYLQASTDIGGRARVAWLDALPERVVELTDRWGLRLGRPFEPGGNCSWVAPGVDPGGRPIVLKVAWPHTEARHEAEGLAALGGKGAVEVLAFEHLGRPHPRSDPMATPSAPPHCCWNDADPGPSYGPGRSRSNTW